ncbi:hypothetical protein PaecuDRAFT_2833 [Paenibacillus curdlanolyticus YK9]|uniref:Uncharacterized protein n=1 Tax=Paenibacillus curdlanolyticus YK9 TaxID=717606 RepID=E0IAJ3_9BACL|nr:hypothetical protein [Paenibacillus curdlanolyticus]EFM10397.1 hypothetical protein PaecuDRAFT_2833 [Paenibacillus curdlanolyticus YK9]
MLDFSFEIIDETRINMQYRYGSAMFTFNLYYQQDNWTLHPFDGMLLQNREMCRLVVAELLQHKDFHVMLARENITLSALRTSIDLQSQEEAAHDLDTRGDRERFGSRSRSRRNNQEDGQDLLDTFIEENTFEDIILMEQGRMEKRIAFFRRIIEKMFMEGYGPEDDEFRNVQAIIRIYKDAYDQLSDLGNLDIRPDDRKRW